MYTALVSARNLMLLMGTGEVSVPEGVHRGTPGLPWPLFPQEALCGTPLAFLSGLRRAGPLRGGDNACRKWGLMRGHVGAGQKFSAGSFYRNIHHQDELAREVGRGTRDSHVWVIASNCTWTEGAGSFRWEEQM